ncbi:LysR family transcriptional regulator [Mycobacterium sp.]|uniref:LysR substrate-binding domain-containing protein n=1 Tax=Mycobacterium sp. TaxID=1785 RepID=UPI002C65124C|nr:LysR family transcriptional regulator [Mycobacterium sp.]HTY35237.1 LysR family transcriptional regulator [Mycobacterium sp.]
MELSQRLLEQFLAVADERNIGRAAERLAMTQPPLTQAIQRLERALGVQLFDRTPRGVELTAAGRSFREDAERLSAAQEAAVRRTRRVAAGLAGVVHVGFAVSLAYRFAPDLLRASADALPELTLHLVQTRTAQMSDAVRSGQLDMAFTRGPVDSADGLVVGEVGRERTVVVLPKHHRLAEKRTVALADLRDEPLVLPSQQSLPGVAAQMLSAFRNAGVSPRVTAYTDELSAMMTYPIAGLAACLVPEQIRAMRHPEVVYRRLSDDLPGLVTRIVAVHRARADDAVVRLLELATSTWSGR